MLIIHGRARPARARSRRRASTRVSSRRASSSSPARATSWCSGRARKIATSIGVLRTGGSRRGGDARPEPAPSASRRPRRPFDPDARSADFRSSVAARARPRRAGDVRQRGSDAASAPELLVAHRAARVRAASAAPASSGSSSGDLNAFVRRAHLRARRAARATDEVDRDRSASAACVGVVSRARPDSHSRQPLPSGDARRDVRRRRRPPHAVPHVRALVRARRAACGRRLLVGVSRRSVGAPILGLFRRVPALGAPSRRSLDRDHRARFSRGSRRRLFTRRGRRLLGAAWTRTVRWEYWPPFVFYAPVALYVLWLGVRHRGLTLFTAANPGIEAGGFINESKAAILTALAGRRGRRGPVAAAPGASDRTRPHQRARACATVRASRSSSSRTPGSAGRGWLVARTWEAVDALPRAGALRRHRCRLTSPARIGVILRASSRLRARADLRRHREAMPAVAGATGGARSRS
mgnify:CR=1 FL=1